MENVAKMTLSAMQDWLKRPVTENPDGTFTTELTLSSVLPMKAVWPNEVYWDAEREMFLPGEPRPMHDSPLGEALGLVPGLAIGVGTGTLVGGDRRHVPKFRILPANDAAANMLILIVFWTEDQKPQIQGTEPVFSREYSVKYYFRQPLEMHTKSIMPHGTDVWVLARSEATEPTFLEIAKMDGERKRVGAAYHEKYERDKGKFRAKIGKVLKPKFEKLPLTSVEFDEEYWHVKRSLPFSQPPRVVLDTFAYNEQGMQSARRFLNELSESVARAQAMAKAYMQVMQE